MAKRDKTRKLLIVVIVLLLAGIGTYIYLSNRLTTGYVFKFSVKDIEYQPNLGLSACYRINLFIEYPGQVSFYAPVATFFGCGSQDIFISSGNKPGLVYFTIRADIQGNGQPNPPAQLQFTVSQIAADGAHYLEFVGMPSNPGTYQSNAYNTGLYQPVTG